MKLSLFVIAFFLIFGMFYESNPLDGKLVEVDGVVYELQHRIFDVYLLHTRGN